LLIIIIIIIIILLLLLFLPTLTKYHGIKLLTLEVNCFTTVSVPIHFGHSQNIFLRLKNTALGK